MKKFGLIILLLCSLASSLSSQSEKAVEDRDRRMEWWREARFGMFIHWGIYAVPANGEWYMHWAKISVGKYEPYAEQFNPVKFDPAEWARIAKNAGMKYIVITSKHHDGFSMFDSKLTEYDIMNTPYKKDILKVLAGECHKQGIKICWYYSVLDWHHPDYLPRGTEKARPWDNRPTENADYNCYIDYMKSQIEELLTNYGDIGILWFDGGWEHNAEEHRAREVVGLIRKLQPDIIINDRIGLPQDYDTPEQHIPPTGRKDRDWETCMTMNESWGYNKGDQKWKSSKILIQNLAKTVSRGGNFLLNVGPTAEGLIPEPSIERLAKIGEWMKINSESIYGTKAGPFKRLEWGDCSMKPKRDRSLLYLHVFKWPEGDLVVPGLLNEINKTYLLSDKNKTPLSFKLSGEDVLIEVPEQVPDSNDTVIVLDIKGRPKVNIKPIVQQDDGSVLLKARDAEIHGQTARYEYGWGKDNIGYWMDKNDWVSWKFKILRPGKFVAEITYACDNQTGGSIYSINVNKEKITGRIKGTGSWTSFIQKEIGEINLAEQDTYKLSVRVESMPKSAVMNLKSIVLRPVK